ncbi:MAG: nitroreductase family protein [Bacteroidales bacterium]|nr:nitroreductase family protein [Bacteroidales bacterium]MEE3447546.1 nitroreductase family protein [Bacteroidales bacterium]
MDLKDILLNHRSVREFARRIVDDSVIKKILNAAIRASNTGNMQLYSIILSTQPKIKDELLPLHFNQMMVKQAPLVFTFCADINRFGKWCKLRNAEPSYDNFLWFSTALTDTVLAAENAALAAENAGLGICFLGTTMYNAEEIAGVLNLPKGVVPVVTMVAGYPAKGTVQVTERLPFEAVVHFERYHDYKDEDIEKYYSELESLEKMKKFVRENNLENLAQVFTTVRYPKESSSLFSQKYLDFVKKSFRI